MIRRVGLFVLILLVTTSLCLAQRSGSGASSNTGNRGSRTNPGTSIPQSSPRRIELVVHVVYPNDRPAGENIDVSLQAAAGGVVKEYFTNSEGEVTFGDISAGSYVITVRGADIKETRSGILTFNSFETMRHEYIHAEPIESATAVGSKEGAVSAAELKVPDKARKELIKGNEAAAKGDSKKAFEHYEKAIALYPQYALAYNNLGATYMNNKDPGHAREAWDKALEADPDLASANANVAKLRILEHNYAAAIPLLEKALSTEPTNPSYLLLMSQAQLFSGHYDQALAYARKVYLTQHAKYEVAHIIAGRALEAENHPDQARIEYEVLLKEAPATPEATEARKSIERLDNIAVKR